MSYFCAWSLEPVEFPTDIGHLLCAGFHEARPSLPRW